MLPGYFPNPLLLFLGRNRQPEHRQLALTRHVHAPRLMLIGQVQRPAVLAPIDFHVRTPGFLDAAALLFGGVRHIKPSLQMATAELSLVVLFVAGSLTWFLNLDLVLGKLRKSAWKCGLAGRQRKHLVQAAQAAGIEPLRLILLEWEEGATAGRMITTLCAVRAGRPIAAHHARAHRIYEQTGNRRIPLFAVQRPRRIRTTRLSSLWAGDPRRYTLHVPSLPAPISHERGRSHWPSPLHAGLH